MDEQRAQEDAEDQYSSAPEDNEESETQRKQLRISNSVSSVDISEKHTVKRTYAFIWYVGNFSGVVHKPPDCIESPSLFTYSRCGALEWRLKLYPRGPTAAHELTLTANLHCEFDETFNVTVNFAIIGPHWVEASRHTSDFHRTQKNGVDFYFHSLRPDYVYENIFGGDVTVRCKITLRDVILETSLGPQRSLEQNCRYVTARAIDFENLFLSEEYSDLKIVVDGQEFKVHRCILASRSSVFAAMFSHGMRESVENVIRITDFTAEVVKELLRFIYAERVENIDSVVMDLLFAADKYEVSGLRGHCATALAGNVCPENVMSYLAVADLFDFGDLKIKAMDCLVENRKQFNKDELKEQIDALSPLLASTLGTIMTDEPSTQIKR